ncbi:MAG: hypothetical protein QOG05_1456 [Streptosporangiaceae bacterium]|nr:hypothetical protein [Streptosporangiaceae bacterium]
MTAASRPADHERTRAAVRTRYAGLARAAQAGETVQDCDPDESTAGCFGPAGYAALAAAWSIRRKPVHAMDIGPMLEEHAAAVLAIYQAGIDEGNATFETHAPAWAEFTAARLPDHRYIARAGGDVLGWVAVSAVSGRCVYAGVVEHSVYVHPGARGQGVGRRLLDTLISSTEAAGIWTIQSGIFPENAASAALHRAAGFRTVGTRERIGQQHGRWRDVVVIERRSPLI